MHFKRKVIKKADFFGLTFYEYRDQNIIMKLVPAN